VDESTPEEVHEGWTAMDTTIGGIERDLREAATSAETLDRRAAEEAEAVSDELAASAEGSGTSSSELRDEVAHLAKAGGGRAEVRDRLSAAAHDLAEARKAEGSARLSDERAKAALEQLRHALREAEEALVELGV
jgi:chromosome segregation ATPase